MKVYLLYRIWKDPCDAGTFDELAGIYAKKEYALNMVRLSCAHHDMPFKENKDDYYGPFDTGYQSFYYSVVEEPVIGP